MRCIVRALAGFFSWIFHEYNQARIFGLDLCVLAGSFLPPAVARDQICLFLAYARQFFAWGHAFIGSILLSSFSFSSGIFLCSHHNFTVSFITLQRNAPRSSRTSPTSPSVRLARSSAPAGGPLGTRRRRPGRTSPSRC